jgi:hypothetical protein
MRSPGLYSSMLLGCFTLGGCIAVAPPSTVEVFVERADNGQPVQNALVEGDTSRSYRGTLVTAIGAPEYVAAFTDERGRASVRVFTGSRAMGNTSSISIKTPDFFYNSYEFDSDLHNETAIYSDGVLHVKLKSSSAKPGPRLTPAELRHTPYIARRARTRLEDMAQTYEARPQVTSPCKACPCPDCGCGPNCSCEKTAQP